MCDQVGEETRYANFGANPSKVFLCINYTRCSAIAETALQGVLVLAKSGRLELGNNILRTLHVYLQPP